MSTKLAWSLLALAVTPSRGEHRALYRDLQLGGTVSSLSALTQVGGGMGGVL